jgi:RNA polymerase sigma factor (TIGR02999 family)
MALCRLSANTNPGKLKWDRMREKQAAKEGHHVEFEPGEVTKLLAELRRGNRDAEEKLIPLVYGELRKLAASYLRRERSEHTLQPTALVHEAYIRLTQLHDVNLKSRTHFFALAARLMRRILVDHARAHQAKKRGGATKTLSLDGDVWTLTAHSKQLIELDEALSRLSVLDPRQVRIVELRFFAGLSEKETGSILGISTRTVKRDWRIAKAWLFQEINK